MPYRRRYGRRRYGRRRYGKPRYTTMGASKFLAKKAWRGVKYLKSLVNAEVYHIDIKYAGTAISTTSNIQHLTGCAQGDDDGNRSGNSIRTKSISYNMTLNMNASATNTWVRWVIVQDTQQVGDTSPTYSEIFDTGASGVTNLLNHATLGRFNIIRDKIFTFNTGGRTCLVKKGRIVLNSHVRYNGSAAGDVQKNGLYIIFLSNEATNTPALSAYFRLFYHDN